MTSRRKIVLLLMPSLLSGTVTAILTVILVSIVAWSHISSEGLFYEFFFGRLGITTLLLSTPTNIFALKDALLGSSVTYYFIVAIAAIMLGLLSYALLQRLGWANQEAKILTGEFRAHDPRLKATLYNDLERLGVRLAGLVAWLLYIVMFAGIIWPFVVSLIQIGLIKISGDMGSGWFNVLEAMILLGVSLHLHIVFARLCALRVRLFGSVVE